jgi:hypothetical protein
VISADHGGKAQPELPGTKLIGSFSRRNAKPGGSKGKKQRHG